MSPPPKSVKRVDAIPTGAILYEEFMRLFWNPPLALHLSPLAGREPAPDLIRGRRAKRGG
jgi:hypothetical protein